MNIKNVLFASLIVLTLSACSAKDTEKQETNFEECVAAGNPVMESYPRQCAHEGETFIEEISNTEPANPTDPVVSETEKPCTREFNPVCGELLFNCTKAPCPPFKTTFENRCLAENEGATNIVEGACVDEEPNPEGACLSFDGKWLPETQECEGMGQEMCENLGGSYNECASACRNNPDSEMCTMQCVQVCKF